MNPHTLPSLPPLDQLPAPGITSTNPGLVNPADQAYPAVKSCDDQTRIAGTHASASAINSNGEQQRVQNRAMANSGVTVSAASVPLTDFSGDSGHRLDMHAPDESRSTGTGLATEVFPGTVNHARMTPPDIAVPLPPSVNVQADTRISGGLPINVHIR
jgi:hypothetical protein